MKITPVQHFSRNNTKTKSSAIFLLATSLRHQTREFFDNSTLHGVRYIAEKDRPFCEKLMWFCFTSIGAVATCIIIVSLWEKFQTNPTITGLDTDFHNWDVPFPAITVCDSQPEDSTLITEFVDRNFPSKDLATKKKVTELLSWLTKLSYKSLAEQASYFEDYADLVNIPLFADIRGVVYSIVSKCDELFKDCQFKGDDLKCCDELYPVFTDVGFCYAFNARHADRYLSLKDEKQFTEMFIHETDTKWSFIFDSLKNETNFKVYIHSTEEMVGLDMTPQHVWDRRVEKVSFSVKHTYTTQDARQLSIKQRRCVFSDEIMLETSKAYTYSACNRQCRMRLARNLCGCIPHFYPLTEGYKYCSIKELSCLGQNAATLSDVSLCKCELSCEHTVYEVEKLSEADKTSELLSPLESDFVSWPMVRYKREVLFGWVDLLVSFGGIAGLFLGFSLLSGVEIIYYFTLRACCAAIREGDTLLAEKKARERAPKPPYNLSLVPWWIQPPGEEPSLKLQPAHGNLPQYSPPPLYTQYLP